MNVLEEVNGSGQTLHANFEAFKFPTSSVVQFRALVTPCIPRYVCHRVTLWGQQINLNHPVYNSEFHGYQWKDLIFFHKCSVEKKIEISILKWTILQ